MYKRFNKNNKRLNNYSERSIFNHIFGFIDEKDNYDDGYGYNNDFNRENRIRNNISSKHYHQIEGVTATTKEHVHEYRGKTIKRIGQDENHIHIFKIITSVADGHTHKMFIKTGPSITSDYGGHIHLIDGMTTVDKGHTHFFGAYTSENIIRK